MAEQTSAAGFATGVPQIFERDGDWYVAMFDGEGLHRVGPTTREKAQDIYDSAWAALVAFDASAAQFRPKDGAA